MKLFFSIITTVFLFLGITPIALAANGPALNADRASTEYTASALTKCSENPKFIERANSATTQKDIARFESCLLYTSPSPRDLSTSRMPSSA